MMSVTAKLIFTASYSFVLIGSVGMVLFSTRFPFAMNNWELELAKERLCGLNGHQVWRYSWVAIIMGTVGQIVGTWVS